MYIYKTTNLINNKIYIGLKTKSVNESENYLGSGVVLKHAIKKYGKANFKKEILESDISDFDLLCKREIYWIEYYNSMNASIGYNRTTGGNGVSGYEMKESVRSARSKFSKGRKWYHHPDTNKNVFVKNKPDVYVKGRYLSEEEKDILTKTHKGKNVYFSKEHKKKISQSLTGKKLSKDHKMKISESKRGSKLTEEHKMNISKSGTGVKKNWSNRTCPHCGLTGKGPNISRYHFDNCKKKS